MCENIKQIWNLCYDHNKTTQSAEHDDTESDNINHKDMQQRNRSEYVF